MHKIFTKYTAEIILFIYLLLFFGIKQPYLEWDRVINSDGKAYYAYLTTTFIYNDLDYDFIEYYEDKYYPSDKSVFKDFRMSFSGEVVNKYFCGLAILWLPFFLLAHLLSSLLGFETDGYSIIYQYAIGLATLFYLWLGCKILIRLLKKFTSSDGVISFIVFSIALGTNIIFYAIVESSMAHIYSFAVITSFIYFTYNAIENHRTKWFVLASVSFAIAFIIRPTNGIFIFLIPFLTGSFQNLKHFFQSLFNNPKTLFYTILSAGLVFAIPIVLWYIQSGYFFVYSYGDEGFNFTNPHFFDLLFSYNRGWLIYTPIAFISMFGFIGLYKINKYRFIIFLLLLIIHIYISSSWWVWHYTSKFSQRSFIDFYAVVAILLIFLFNSVKNKIFLKKLLFVIISILITLNIFQFYQHWKWVFPSDYITGEIYRDSFTRLIPQAKVYIPEKYIINNVEFFINNEKDRTDTNIIINDSIKENKFTGINYENPYSNEFRKEIKPHLISSNAFIKINADIFSN
ncbi:MAG: hypothetical protein K8R58_01560, partial [Bacteroidales bacterium]|nr:hypothetical protein [Bacteroidales bacterium]